MNNFNIDDMPNDVFWVFALQISGTSVGLETYNKCVDIVKKYPNWFAWEHKYASIPQEVHDAYWEEINPKFKLSFESNNKGILEATQEGTISSDEFEKNKQKSVVQLFEELMASEYLNKENERKDRERRQAIWHKHYSKFNLEYKESFINIK